jgi:hypothetical protein
MWVIEDHLRPSGHIMPDHAGDQGAAHLVLAPHDHLHINHVRAWAFPTAHPWLAVEARGRQAIGSVSDASGRRHRPPVAAWCCRAMSPGMRPRSLSAMPCSLAQAPMSALRARLDAVRRPLPLFSASPAGVFDVGGELPAESGGVAGVQVDLVVGAADPGLDRLIRRATLEIVLETTVIVVAIVASMPVMGYLQSTDHLPEPRSSAPAAAPLVRRFGEPTAADVRPYQATTSHSCCS